MINNIETRRDIHHEGGSDGVYAIFEGPWLASLTGDIPECKAVRINGKWYSRVSDDVAPGYVQELEHEWKWAGGMGGGQ